MTDLGQVQHEAEQEWLARWREGPRRLRWTRVPPQVGDAAPDRLLVDSEGAAVQLSDLWREGPLVLLFWRHYGCGCGVDRATRLMGEQPGYERAGAQVVVVGQGEPSRAKAYAERFGLRTRVLCDPGCATYEAYGLLEGTTAQLLYDASEELQRGGHEAGLRLADERRVMGRPMVDNPWQMPGEFVIDASGQIALAYRYQYCEDFPDPRVIEAALKGLRSG